MEKKLDQVDDGQREIELLETCRAKQGEYLNAGHPKTSWATTYGTDFITASAELYELYRKRGPDIPAYVMSQAFQSMGILSCRGAKMTIDRVNYLINAHLLPFLEKPRSSSK